MKVVASIACGRLLVSVITLFSACTEVGVDEGRAKADVQKAETILVSGLKARDERVRGLALRYSQGVMSEVVVNQAAALLAAESPYDRKRAIAVIGAARGKGNLALVVPLLRDRSVDVQASAAAWLIRGGVRTAEAGRVLQKLVTELVPGSAQIAASALPAPEAYAILANGLRSDRDKVRSICAHSLLLEGEPRSSLRLLLGVVDDNKDSFPLVADSIARIAADAGLTRTEADRLARCLMAIDKKDRFAPLVGLVARYGAKGAPLRLVDQAVGGNSPPEFQEVVMRGLASRDRVDRQWLDLAERWLAQVPDDPKSAVYHVRLMVEARVGNVRALARLRSVASSGDLDAARFLARRDDREAGDIWVRLYTATLMEPEKWQPSVERDRGEMFLCVDEDGGLLYEPLLRAAISSQSEFGTVATSRAIRAVGRDQVDGLRKEYRTALTQHPHRLVRVVAARHYPLRWARCGKDWAALVRALGDAEAAVRIAAAQRLILAEAEGNSGP